MTQILRRILCIDDEEDILEIVKLCLGEIGGFDVACEPEVCDALERLEALAPDLIMIDYMMPRMNGMDAVHAIRSKKGFEKTPLVLMTARVQSVEIQEYFSGGATAIVAKPFDPMTLAETIGKIWRDFHDRK